MNRTRHGWNLLFLSLASISIVVQLLYPLTLSLFTPRKMLNIRFLKPDYMQNELLEATTFSVVKLEEKP